MFNKQHLKESLIKATIGICSTYNKFIDCFHCTCSNVHDTYLLGLSDLFDFGTRRDPSE